MTNLLATAKALASEAHRICAETWGEVRGGHATGDIIWKLADRLNDVSDLAERLQEENQKLREALENVKHALDCFADEPVSTRSRMTVTESILLKARDIARAALQPNKET